MKRIRNLYLDNQGGSLILVIVCISFISILCSVLLSVTVNNAQMKSVDRKAKSNFYDTEIAFDEIKKGLEEIVAFELETAYNQAMSLYIDKSEAEKKAAFSDTFFKGLRKTLGGTEEATTYSIPMIKSFIKQEKAVLATAADKNIITSDTGDINNPQYIILENIKVRYQDSEDYLTTISANIVIDLPKVSFNYSAISLRPIFSEYSLIADKKILLDTAPMVQIKGNVYAGLGGIDIKNNSSVNISDASNVITRGDISVSERSTLTIVDNPKIWARKLSTLSGASTENPTTIDISGRCYIADDLLLNALNSVVTIRGEYYGYSYESYKDLDNKPIKNAENSSAIIINGYKSKLDLSGLNKLVIAGRAYLDPKSKGNQYVEEVGKEQGKVQTGESLAIKGNQLVYLVPSEYLWCEQNPVSRVQYEEFIGSPNGKKEVDFNKIVADTKIDLREYVDFTEGYTKIFYTLGENQDFVYYYLKFESEEKANSYLKKYYEIYNSGVGIGIIDHNVKRFASSIKLNPLNTMMSLGNIFTFDMETGKSMLYSNTIIPEGIDNVNLNALTQMAANLSSRYDALKERLVETALGDPYDKDSLFHTIVHSENIQSDQIKERYPDGVKQTILNSEYVIYIIDSTVDEFHIPFDDELPSNGRKGIIVSTGSVQLDGEYTGLIIAKGEIKLMPGAVINAPNGMLEEIFAFNHPDINRYFRDYASYTVERSTLDAEHGRILLSDLIYYENWKKNEE